MNKISLIALLMLVLVGWGCSPKPSRVVDGTGDAVQEGVSEADQNNMPMEIESEGWDEELGERVLRGKITTTKGEQAMLEGVILDSDYFGEDWRKKIDALKGKRVEAKGKLRRHHCGSMEQCLSQGYIDSLYEIEYVKET